MSTMSTSTLKDNKAAGLLCCAAKEEDVVSLTFQVSSYHTTPLYAIQYHHSDFLPYNTIMVIFYHVITSWSFLCLLSLT